MKKILLISVVCSFFLDTFAQLPDGSTAPDWTSTDLDGNSHNLYELLDQGYTVFLDFSATWCTPCWNYHHSGAFSNLYNQYGPSGTNEVRCFMIEADPSTPECSLYGTCGGTIGNWVDGTPYPIINDASIGDLYAIAYYPTIYAVCPDRTVYEVGQLSTNGLYNHHQNQCALSYSIFNLSHEQCYQSNDGSIELSVSGNTGNETYQWSDGQNSRVLTNVGKGTYTCTITDGSRTLVTDPIEVQGPDAPVEISENNSMVEDAKCADEASGSIILSTSGGTPPYFYQWGDGSTGAARYQLPAEFYYVTVRDNNGCMHSASFTIAEPDPIQIDELETFAENCDQADGEVIIDAYGGTGMLEFKLEEDWSDENIFTGLPTGEYEIKIRDENDCQISDSLEISFIEAPIADAGTTQKLTCKDSTVTLDGSQSTTGEDILYQWTTVDGAITGSVDGPEIDVTEPGIYELEVTDTQSGCTAVDEIAVTVDRDMPHIEFNQSPVLTCLQPSIDLIPGDNTSQGDGFMYRWFNEEGEILSTDSSITISDPGNYNLEIENIINGCTAFETVEIEEHDNTPVASFTGNQSGFELHLINQSAGSLDEVHWEASNGWSSDEENPVFPLNTNGEIEICLRIENECGQDEICETYIIDLTGYIVQRDSEGKPADPSMDFSKPGNISLSDTAIPNLRVYPNPTNSEIQVISEESIQDLALFSLKGHLIPDISVDASSHKLSISVGHLPDGVYVLRIKTRDKAIYRRVVKQAN